MAMFLKLLQGANSLHHFSEGEEIGLYKKIYVWLRETGMYVESDYNCKTIEEQLSYIPENERLRGNNS